MNMKTHRHVSYRNILNFALAVGLALELATAHAQQFVYPAKGQSPEQQNKDEYECHTWVVGQTGFDPTKPAAAPAPQQVHPSQPTGPTGARVRGAPAGAAVGAIAGKDKSDAAVGAAVGAGAAQRGQRRQAVKQQRAAAQQRRESAAYQNARAACLQGRGYTGEVMAVAMRRATAIGGGRQPSC